MVLHITIFTLSIDFVDNFSTMSSVNGIASTPIPIFSFTFVPSNPITVPVIDSYVSGKF